MTTTRFNRLYPALLFSLTIQTMMSAAAAGGYPGDPRTKAETHSDAAQDHQRLENRRLAWALWHRQADDVAAALMAGADPNARFPAWQYEDFRADEPPTLTPQKAFPKYDDFWRNSLPVMMSVQNGYYVPVLKDAGADVDARDSDGDTPLLFMARGGLASLCWGDNSYQGDMIKSLLQAGADVHARDHDGNTVLHLLEFHINPNEHSDMEELESAIQLLVRDGADVNAKNDAGQTVLQSLEAHFADGQDAADKRQIIAILKRSLMVPSHPPAAHTLMGSVGVQGSKPELAPALGTSPEDGQDHKLLETWMLAWAVCHDNGPAAKAALRAGADPSARFTCLQYFKFQKDDPPAPAPERTSGGDEEKQEHLPLIFAAGTGTAKLLVSAGADVDARDADGETPLIFYAADRQLELEPDSDIGDHRSCDVDMMAAYLQAGANVNARDHDGDTALHLIHNCLSNAGPGRDNPDEVVAGIRLLARRGADMNAKNDAGQTVLQVTEASWGAGYAYGSLINATLRSLGARSPHTVRPCRSHKKG
jgi:ankyrin repeat protein